MPSRRWLAPLVLLVLVLGLATLAPAQDEGRDAEAEPRDVRVEQGDREFAVHLHPADEEEEAETVSLEVEPPNGTLALVRGDGDGANLGLEVQLDALVEYRDDDGNGSYDPGEPVPSVRGVGAGPGNGTDGSDAARWGSAIVTDVSRQGVEGKRIVLPAQVGEGGTLTLRMLTFGETVEVANTSLAPTSVKLDLVVENYPFQANDTDLALFVTARTPAEDVADDHRSLEDGEEGLVATREADGEASTFLFAWQAESAVDGETTPVETTQLGLLRPVEDAEAQQETRRTGPNDTDNRTDAGAAGDNLTQRRVALSYERGDRIVHDPRTDVAVTEVETTEAPGAGLVGLLVALLTAQAVPRRE